MDAGRDDRSLGQLFADLSRQLSTLVRQEIDLARSELMANARTLTRDVSLVAVGGAVLYAGLLALVATLILALIQIGLDPWISALIVGVIVAAIGAALIARGRAGLANADLAPRRTIETLKDDADWAKEQIK